MTRETLIKLRKLAKKQAKSLGITSEKLLQIWVRICDVGKKEFDELQKPSNIKKLKVEME
jgi:hypothetical protein